MFSHGTFPAKTIDLFFEYCFFNFSKSGPSPTIKILQFLYFLFIIFCESSNKFIFFSSAILPTNKITKKALVNFEVKNSKLIPIYASQLKLKEENLCSDDPDNMLSCNYKSANITITYFFQEETINVEVKNEEIKKLKASIERRKKLLANENYVNKAPSNIVSEDRKKLKEEEEKLANLLG